MKIMKFLFHFAGPHYFCPTVEVFFRPIWNKFWKGRRHGA